jgi:HlyD family secretion protein
MTVPGTSLNFQSDLERIIQAPSPTWLRLTGAVLALALVASLAAAALLHIDIVVSGPGVLATDHPTALLQAMDRAVVRSLRVRVGDRVKKGEILATLDPTFAQADVAAQQAQRRTLQAQEARLLAEADGRDDMPGDGAGSEAVVQARLFRQRKLEYAARLNAFDQSLAHDMAEQATSRVELASLRRQADIAAMTRRLREELLRGAVGSRLQFLDADAAGARAEGARDATASRMAELQAAARSAAADRLAFMEGWKRQTIESLAQTRDALAQNDAALAKAARLQDLVNVTAPEDGIVLQVAARAPGSVLASVDPLLTLLPAHAALVAEITVKSSDIGYLRVGELVRVKVDAYPFQRHGVLLGRVRAIAAASQPQEGGRPGDPLTAGAVHRVSIDLGRGGLANLPDGAQVTPGMTVSGDVLVGTRSVLAYFMAPVTRGFAQSLREP